MIETSHKQIIWDSIVCLIVDDDKFSRTFVKTALYQIGIKNTKEAGNTEEAAELLHNFKIDVILLDQQMPNQSGLEFARELKSGKIDGAKNIPIIMPYCRRPFREAKSRSKQGAHNRSRAPSR